MDVPKPPPIAPPSTPAYPHATMDPHSPADGHRAPPPAYGNSYPGSPYMHPHYAPSAPSAMPTGPQHNTFGHPHGAPLIPTDPSAASQGTTICIASSLLPPMCGLDDYCDTCGHNAATKTKLEALGFEPGDMLDRIPSMEYEKVGFKYLEWRCIVKADKAHRLLAKARC